MKKKTILLLLTLLFPLFSLAQDFIDLSSEQMSIDSVLPRVTNFFALPRDCNDSVYTVSLLYPEYTRLKRSEAKKFRTITGSRHTVSEPVITYDRFTDRKQTSLRVTFCPIVEIHGVLYYLSSYLPRITSEPSVTSAFAKQSEGIEAVEYNEELPTYAKESVLRSGKWAKIRVSSTGIVRLTKDVIRRAGFTDMSKVRVYGYGGTLIPARLTQSYLREHDDLKEVPTCMVDGEKYFFANGSVSWASPTDNNRTRNPYSDYGYYFITQGTEDALTTTEDALLAQAKADYSAYHHLYEKDGFAWEQIGRNLVDDKAITIGKSATYNILIPKENTTAQFRIIVTANVASGCRVQVGAESEKTATISGFGQYDKAKAITLNGCITSASLSEAKTDAAGNYVVPVTISCTSGGPVRLDYIATSFAEPRVVPSLSPTNCVAASYVYNITNQNMHADTPVDMVIIIPTSQKLRRYAQTLADYHAKYDSMTVRIVPADELYNEFSSGTPDVSAYRRYLKMFYDKDKSSDGSASVKYCLLFGDCVWDNRMLTLPSSYNPDDYLLGYQTENSYSMTNSITSDDFIGVLRDNTTIHADELYDRNMLVDVAVGRITAGNTSQAEVAVNKIMKYMAEAPAGEWQNEIMFIGDDGDNNSHMRNIDVNADAVISRSPGYTVTKVLFDAYKKEKTFKSESYPVVNALVRDRQKRGALIMNYGGHASPIQMADEKMLMLADIEAFRGDNYSLWFTAACETMPFAMTESNIGEAAFFNAAGGAVAFVGTVGTVYEDQNSQLNRYFMKHVLSYGADDKPIPVGEALRLAKNDLIKGTDPMIGSDNSINKHHYHLLGDPAMRLALPYCTVVIDSIDGKALTDATQVIHGNSVVKVTGHIEDHKGNRIDHFNGMADITIKDSRQTITCRGQNGDNKYKFQDYNSNLFVGTCRIDSGNFAFSLRVPRDIYDDGGNGLITVYARDEQNKLSANGMSSAFSVQGWSEVENDSVGPYIYAYINDRSFRNGGDVCATPFFVAELSDADGINVNGSGIGHDLELIVDGKAAMTYNLNDNFVFDEDSYTSGQTYYVLPQLAAGYHTLTFRAWDMLSNCNTVTLSFRVVKGMAPTISDISVGPNPVRGTATFYVTHDMQGSDATLHVDIIDMSGRLVETMQWNDRLSESSPVSAYRWTPSKVSPGIYLYRVRLSANGSDYVSKTKRLIIAQ